MQGKIIKGIAGFYYVYGEDGELYECKAKGIFRKDKQKPLVGDNVEITVLDPDKKEGNLVEIFPRKNSLIRPAVANVDQAFVIFAADKPRPNFMLLDRFLITCPKGLKIAPWVKVPKQDAAIIERPFRVWKEIIDKAVALPFTEGIFNVLDFSDEAIDIFYDWQNEDIERQNAITDEKMIDSRAAKVPLNTARLALIFQLFRWACDESHKDFVDAESVNAAIRMSDYFEKSYKRMDDLVLTEATDPVKKQVLDSLGNKFVTAEAVKAGADFGFARRTVMYMLKDFCQRNFIIKDKQGNYEKVQK